MAGTRPPLEAAIIDVTAAARGAALLENRHGDIVAAHQRKRLAGPLQKGLADVAAIAHAHTRQPLPDRLAIGAGLDFGSRTGNGQAARHLGTKRHDATFVGPALQNGMRARGIAAVVAHGLAQQTGADKHPPHDPALMAGAHRDQPRARHARCGNGRGKASAHSGPTGQAKEMLAVLTAILTSWREALFSPKSPGAGAATRHP